MTEDMPLSLMHFQAEAAKLRQFEADDLAAKRPAEPQPASAPQMKRARVDAEMMASAPGSKDASESVRLENKCGQPTKYSTPCLFSKQCANCGACFRHCPCKSGQEKKCGYQLKTGTGCSRIGNCPACSYCRQSHCTCDPKDVMPLPRGSAGSSKHAKCLHQVKDGTQCNRSGNCPTCKRCLQFHCLCASTAEAEDAVTATSGQINQAHKVLPRCARDLKGGKKCNRRGNCPKCHRCRQAHCTCQVPDDLQALNIARGVVLDPKLDPQLASARKNRRCVHVLNNGAQCNRSGNCPHCKRCRQYHCTCSGEVVSTATTTAQANAPDASAPASAEPGVLRPLEGCLEERSEWFSDVLTAVDKEFDDTARAQQKLVEGYQQSTHQMQHDAAGALQEAVAVANTTLSVATHFLEEMRASIAGSSADARRWDDFVVKQKEHLSSLIKTRAAVMPVDFLSRSEQMSLHAKLRRNSLLSRLQLEDQSHNNRLRQLVLTSEASPRLAEERPPEPEQHVHSAHHRRLQNSKVPAGHYGHQGDEAEASRQGHRRGTPREERKTVHDSEEAFDESTHGQRRHEDHHHDHHHHHRHHHPRHRHHHDDHDHHFGEGEHSECHEGHHHGAAGSHQHGHRRAHGFAHNQDRGPYDGGAHLEGAGGRLQSRSAYDDRHTHQRDATRSSGSYRRVSASTPDEAWSAEALAGLGRVAHSIIEHGFEQTTEQTSHAAQRDAHDSSRSRRESTPTEISSV